MKKNLLRIVISFGFLGLLFYLMRDDIPVIGKTLKTADKSLIAVAVLVFLSTVVILAKRLELIFEAEDVRIRVRETISLTDMMDVV